MRFKNSHTIIIVLNFLLTPVIGQSIELPSQSNVYPEAFAVYWKRSQLLKSDDKILMRIRVFSAYDDTFLETEASEDTLVTIPFMEEFMSERILHVHGDYTPRDNHFGGWNQKLLRIIPKSPKIEAMIDLAETNFSTNNLIHLAEAFEEERCYVNAFYIYKRMLSSDPETGKLHFDRFCERYRLLFSHNAVHR